MIAHGAKIVLVVEEQHDARDELAEALRRIGFIAIPVADADSAGVVVQRLRPDLILWHAVAYEPATLVVVSGWKARRPDSRIVVVLRAPAPGDDRMRQCGADAVLTTPVARGSLERLVFQLLHAADLQPPAGA